MRGVGWGLGGRLVVQVGLGSQWLRFERQRPLKIERYRTLELEHYGSLKIERRRYPRVEHHETDAFYILSPVNS